MSIRMKRIISKILVFMMMFTISFVFSTGKGEHNEVYAAESKTLTVSIKGNSKCAPPELFVISNENMDGSWSYHENKEDNRYECNVINKGEEIVEGKTKINYDVEITGEWDSGETYYIYLRVRQGALGCDMFKGYNFLVLAKVVDGELENGSFDVSELSNGICGSNAGDFQMIPNFIVGNEYSDHITDIWVYQKLENGKYYFICDLITPPRNPYDSLRSGRDVQPYLPLGTGVEYGFQINGYNGDEYYSVILKDVVMDDMDKSQEDGSIITNKTYYETEIELNEENEKTSVTFRPETNTSLITAFRPEYKDFTYPNYSAFYKKDGVESYTSYLNIDEFDKMVFKVRPVDNYSEQEVVIPPCKIKEKGSDDLQDIQEQPIVIDVNTEEIIFPVPLGPVSLDLKSLSWNLNGGTSESVPDFDANKTDYDVELPIGTTDMPEVSAEAVDSRASISYEQASELPGRATVTVSDTEENRKEYYVDFSVKMPELKSITFHEELYTLNVEDQKETKVTASYGMEYPSEDDLKDKATYKSDDTSIVTIDNQGYITGHKEGTTSIHAFYGEETCETQVEVNDIPRFTITPNTLTEKSLDEATLTGKLSMETFQDEVLDINNFTLNIPLDLAIEGFERDKLEIDSLQYIDNTTAEIVLEYTGGDFDQDIEGLTITVSGAELNSESPLTSNTFGVNAYIETNHSSGGSSGGGSSKPDKKEKKKEKEPDGDLTNRMPGHKDISKGQIINTAKKEIVMEYDKEFFDENPQYQPRIYYWNNKINKWVALATYPDKNNRVKAINDGSYKGWFKVFAVLQPEFTDVKDHWGEDTANRMNGLAIVEGYEIKKGKNIRVLKPDQSITRGEFAVLIYRLLNIDLDKPTFKKVDDDIMETILTSKFSDSDSIPSWAKQGITVLAFEKILGGRDGKCEANKPITRIEAAIMTSRALQKLDKFNPADFSNFKDADDIPDWAKHSISQDVLNGYPDGTLKPNDHIKRIEALTILQRLFINGMGW